MPVATMAVAVLTVLLTAAAVSAAGGDVADYLNRTVVSTVVEEEGRPVQNPALLELLESTVGEPLRMRDVRASVAHLFSLGRFADVVVRATAEAGGVALRYELTPIHPIERIVFSGIAGVGGLNEDALRRAVIDRFGASPAAARAGEIEALVSAELRNRGYRRAGVSARVDVSHAEERGTLVLTVEPGERSTIADFSFSGGGALQADVARRLALRRGAAYQPIQLQARIDDSIEALQRQGFYEARVSVSARFSADERTVTLIAAVEPGSKIRVEFTGDPLPADRLDELVPIGREGAADEDLLEDSVQRILEYLRGQGYRDAAAAFTREEAGGELIVRFTVTRGPQYRVARVVIEGNRSLRLDELAPALRIREGQVFSAAALSAQATAIQDLYARRGYARARATSEVELLPATDPTHIPVTVRVTISEQLRIVVRSVQVRGNRFLSEAELIAGLGMRVGQPFYPTQLAIDQDAVQLRYANAGFRTATVSSSPGLSEDGTSADVVFTVEEGPQVFVDHILIVGNGRTSSDTIRRELQFKSGDPLGLEAVTESQRRLATLGLFRRTRLTELGHGAETRRDVLVVVEEAPVTTLGYGGGLETKPVIRGSAAAGGIASEQLEFAPRAFFEIGRRNLFGKNRSVNLFTRISFRPQNFSGRSPSSAAGGYGFSEYRAIATYREPRVRGTAADAFLTGILEQQRRASFNFARRALTAELLRRLTREISVTGNYQLQRTELFDERIDPGDRLLIDRLFPQVRLSSFSLSAIRDSRDDLIDPQAGSYVSANAQVAARHIGSAVGLFKSYFTAQAFKLVPQARRMVVATSVRVGVAVGFPRTATEVGDDGEVVTRTIRELPASERFFAGGDTTVRGFALDQLGTSETIGEGGFPVGGNAVVILNAELRLPVRGGFGIVGFLDTGNVFDRTSSVDLGALRSAVGFGIRYKSPVGPIRVDVGFKANRRDISPGVREDPTAIHISLGQAF